MSMPRNLASMTVVAALVLSAAACSKNDDASKPTGVPAMANPPPAAPAATPPPPPTPERSPASPGGASVGGAGPSQGPAVDDKPADPNAKIVGHVVLAPAMKKHVATGDTVFIIARRVPDNPTARGSLVAVKRVTVAKFPIEFELSAADMPFQNGAFDGELQLTVRSNKSGDPMMRRKGDVFGLLPKVKVGAKNVKLPLDTLQKEDESLAQPGANPHGGPGAPGGPMGGGALPPGHP